MTTVAQLIEKLQQYPPDMRVGIWLGYDGEPWDLDLDMTRAEQLKLINVTDAIDENVLMIS